MTTDTSNNPSEPASNRRANAACQRTTPCFTRGTLIATRKGELPVELLEVGDRVITRDNGLQEVRWIGHRHFQAQDFRAEPHLCPVLVRQGSLGRNLPERDLLLSPNHRVLVTRDRSTLASQGREVLVAAKHLIREGGRGVASSGTTYLHIMFDRHEVVLSNGAWTESFLPEDTTLKGMGNAQRLEIYDLFPELKMPDGRKAYAAARPVVASDIPETTAG